MGIPITWFPRRTEKLYSSSLIEADTFDLDVMGSAVRQ